MWEFKIKYWNHSTKVEGSISVCMFAPWHGQAEGIQYNVLSKKTQKTWFYNIVCFDVAI